MEIGLSVPIKSLYKNYELRKIQFMKFMKSKQPNMSQEENENFESMKSYFQIGINYDREFMKYKIEKMTNTSYKNLEKNFDEDFKGIFDKLTGVENAIIGGDVSFNIAVINLFFIF